MPKNHRYAKSLDHNNYLLRFKKHQQLKINWKKSDKNDLLVY